MLPNIKIWAILVGKLKEHGEEDTEAYTEDD
jgi:hypothetical protein